MADPDTSTHNDGGLLHSFYDYVASKLSGAPPPKPAYSYKPLGTGVAAAGAEAVSGRQKQLDKQIAEAGG